MIAGIAERAGGREGPVGPTRSVAVGADRTRGRGRSVASDLIGTSSAVFVGLLLVRSAAEALEPRERATVPPSADGLPATGEAAPDEVPAPSADFTAVASPVAGSVLTAGIVIDPALLTRLAGEARFDAGGAVSLLGPRPVPGPAEGADAAPVLAPPMATIDHEPIAWTSAPSLEAGDPPGEDLGPIGEELVGSDGDDVLVGGPDDDRIAGGAGDDTLIGAGGDDILDGGPGNDTLDGGPGHDVLVGDEGNDTLLGGPGNDRLDGGPGDDQIDGGAGDDVTTGGTGDDRVTVDTPADLVFEDPWGRDGGGRDTLVVAPDFGAQLEKAWPILAKGGLATFMVGDAVLGSPPPGAPPFKWQVPPNVENVRLTGGEAHAVVGDDGPNVLEGNEAANKIWGGGGDDRVRGGAGDDQLFGGPGNDLLMGDEGDDLLAGGAGDDLLYGGPGNDTYVLGLAEVGVDRIFDLEGANRIRIDGADPARLTARLEGDDLHLAYEGRDRAVVVGHRGHEQALATIEIDGRSYRPADFLPTDAPSGGDLLADFLDPGASHRMVVLDAPLDGVIASAQAPTGPGGFPELFPGADLWAADPVAPDGEAAGERGASGVPADERVPLAGDR